MKRYLLAFMLLLLVPGAVPAEPTDFTLPDLDGKQRRLSEFRGKWVLVNYWATWCPPCLEELPELEVFHNKHKDENAVVVGVNMEEIGLARLRAFIEEQFISFPILRGTPAASTELGAVPGLPTSYLVSPAGEVVARQTGMVDGRMIERFIQRYTQRQANQEKR